MFYVVLDQNNLVGGGHLNPDSISQSAFKSEHLLSHEITLARDKMPGLLSRPGCQSIPSRSAEVSVKVFHNFR